MSLPVYPMTCAVPLHNEQYYDWLWQRITTSHQRIWVSVFIMNVSSAHDTDLRVREIAKHLAYAQWRNVDVRLLLGASQIGAIQIQNSAAAGLLAEMGIETRSFESVENTSLHSKYVLFDDEWVLVGSNNWSPGGFAGHREDALAVCSSDLNTSLSDNFLKHWNESKTDQDIIYGGPQYGQQMV